MACACAYPRISTFIHPEDPNARSSNGMGKLKDHALELARGGIYEEIEELRRLNLDPNAPTYFQKKEHILTKLKRSRPGETCTPHAVKIDEEVMSTSKPIDCNLLAQWLASRPRLRLTDTDEAAPQPAPGGGRSQGRYRRSASCQPEAHTFDRWNVDKKDIEQASTIAGKSAPGPDKMPYQVWKNLGLWAWISYGRQHRR